MARLADICDARALRLASAHTVMGSAWEDYAADKTWLVRCEPCGQAVPASGTVSDDGEEWCVLCEAKKPQEGDY